VIEQEIDIELALSNLNPILATYESEHVAHLAQERINSARERSVRLSFAMLVFKVKESKGVLILNRQVCLRLN
jgi:hypothetical protein